MPPLGLDGPVHRIVITGSLGASHVPEWQLLVSSLRCYNLALIFHSFLSAENYPVTGLNPPRTMTYVPDLSNRS